MNSARKTVSECIETPVVQVMEWRPANGKSIARPELSDGIVPDRIRGKEGKSLPTLMKPSPSGRHNLKDQMPSNKREHVEIQVALTHVACGGFTVIGDPPSRETGFALKSGNPHMDSIREF